MRHPRTAHLICLAALSLALAAASALGQTDAGAPSPAGSPSGSASVKSPPAKTAEPAVEFPSNSKREIGINPGPDGKAIVRYPFKLPGGVAASGAYVDTIMSGLRDAGTDEAWVTARVVTGHGGYGQDIELTIDFKKRTVKPGTYDIRVRFDPAASPDTKPAPLYNVVQLVILPARVRTLSKQVIEVIGGEPVVKPSLHVVETSDASRLSITDASLADGVHKGDAKIAPVLRASAPPGPIPPGGSGDIPITLDGDFPLGTSTAKLTISAPELESSIDVDYEIRSRRDPLLIILIAAAGLVVGFGVREWLAKLTKLGDAQTKAGELLIQLDQERRQRQDKVFRERVSRALADLSTKLQTAADAETVTAAMTQAEGQLREAVEDLKKRKTEAAHRFDDLKELLQTKYHLPAKLRERLAAAAPALNDAAARLDADDADGAPLAAIEADLADAAATLGTAWRTKVLHALQRLPPLDALVADANGGPTPSALQAALANKAAEGAKAKDRLDELDRVYVLTSTLEYRLLLEVGKTAEQIAAIAPAAGSKPEAVTDLLDEVVRLEQLHDDESQDAGELLLRVSPRLPNLLRDAVLALLPGGPPALRTSIEQKLASGAYADAVNAIPKQRVPASTHGLEGVRVGTVEPPAQDDFPVASAAAEPPRRFGQIQNVATAARAASIGATVGETMAPAPFIRDAKRLSLQARVLTALINGGLITVITYAVHKDTFIGTPMDCMTVLAWTLGVNLATIDAVTTALTKVTSKSA